MKFIEPLWSISFCFKPIQQPQPPRRCILLTEDMKLLEPEVQDVLRSAQTEVIIYDHRTVHTVHVLVAMAEMVGCDVAKFIRSEGIGAEEVRNSTYGLVTRRKGEPYGEDGQPLFAMQVNRAVELVVQNEDALGDADLQMRLLLNYMMVGRRKDQWSPVIIQALKRLTIDTATFSRRLLPAAA